MLEKLALLKIALCKAPVARSASECRTSALKSLESVMRLLTVSMRRSRQPVRCALGPRVPRRDDRSIVTRGARKRCQRQGDRPPAVRRDLLNRHISKELAVITLLSVAARRFFVVTRDVFLLPEDAMSITSGGKPAIRPSSTDEMDALRITRRRQRGPRTPRPG